MRKLGKLGCGVARRAEVVLLVPWVVVQALLLVLLLLLLLLLLWEGGQPGVIVGVRVVNWWRVAVEGYCQPHPL